MEGTKKPKSVEDFEAILKEWCEVAHISPEEIDVYDLSTLEEYSYEERKNLCEAKHNLINKQ